MQPNINPTRQNMKGEWKTTSIFFYGRQPQFFFKRKTTPIFLCNKDDLNRIQMEDDLNTFQNGNATKNS